MITTFYFAAFVSATARVACAAVSLTRRPLALLSVASLLVACGGSTDPGAPMCAAPGESCDVEPCCAGTVCAVAESGERACIMGAPPPGTCSPSVADRGYPMCDMAPLDVDALYGTTAGCPMGQWRGAEPCLYEQSGMLQAFALCIDHAKINFTCDVCAPGVSCGVNATCDQGVCVPN